MRMIKRRGVAPVRSGHARTQTRWPCAGIPKTKRVPAGTLFRETIIGSGEFGSRDFIEGLELIGRRAVQ